MSPKVETRRTPKQRVRAVLQGLNAYFPKFAIQRAADRIQNVWDANELENPEVEKMLDDLLAFLKKAKTAKTKANEMEDMPADFGWEKSPEEIKAEEKLNKRTGQIETVAVRGTVVEDAATGTPVASQPAATAKIDAKVTDTTGKPIGTSKK